MSTPSSEAARLVAFLRGINLGKRRVKMAALRSHFRDFGLTGVESYIASGNVLFDDPAGAEAAAQGALERQLEAHLEEALGFATDVFLRPFPRLEELAGLESLTEAEEEGFNPYVIFLRGPADEEAEAELDELSTPDDRFLVLGREVVWLRRGKLTGSTLSTRDVARALGTASTRRNVRTVRRMVAKFG